MTGLTPPAPRAQPLAPRLERLAAGVGLAVVSTTILLASLEGGLRLYDRIAHGAPIVQADPREDLYQSHPYLPAVLRPASDYRDADTAGHVNSLGLRGPERPAGKIPGTIRVLCVGGSTTFGAGIVGDENTWPARLEARIREARPDLAVEVWNAGVPGYTTAENLIYMSLRLLDFEPDIVVFYEGYNDFKPNRHPGFRSDYAHWRDRAVAPRRPWLERFRIYTRLRSVIDRLRADPAAPVRDAGTGRELPRFDTASGEGLRTFQRNLRSLIALARTGGGEPVLATWAHPCTEENLRAHPGLFTYLPGFVPGLTFAGVREAFDRHNEVIRSVAAETGARVADAALLVPPDPSLFVDHVHFNALGADRFAGVIAGAVAPLLPERSRPAAGQPLPAPARASSATTSR